MGWKSLKTLTLVALVGAVISPAYAQTRDQLAKQHRLPDDVIEERVIKVLDQIAAATAAINAEKVYTSVAADRSCRIDFRKAKQLKRQAEALNRQYAGRADQTYRTKMQKIKDSNKRHLKNYRKCFEKHIHSHKYVTPYDYCKKYGCALSREEARIYLQQPIAQYHHSVYKYKRDPEDLLGYGVGLRAMNYDDFRKHVDKLKQRLPPGRGDLQDLQSKLHEKLRQLRARQDNSRNFVGWLDWFSGLVDVCRNDQCHPARKGMRIYRIDMIHTGSRGRTRIKFSHHYSNNGTTEFIDIPPGQKVRMQLK